MLEHLPPGSPWHRERAGTPWQDEDWMLHDISSRLRDLLVLTRNLWRGKNEPPVKEPDYLPTPPGADDPGAHEAQEHIESTQQAELSALVHRRG